VEAPGFSLVKQGWEDNGLFSPGDAETNILGKWAIRSHTTMAEAMTTTTLHSPR
jgi:hypothetical protein